MNNSISNTDFIKVSKDGWGFEKSVSGERFIPFGSNFIFNYRGDPDGENSQNLHILVQDNFKPDVIKKVFYKARELNMNTMKVFMAAPYVIKNDLMPGEFAVRPMTPSLFERLDFLFDLAKETGIYISLTFAEWGMTHATWFHQGGTFFGCRDEGKPNSFFVLESFWKAVAAHCKNRPELLSYNLAVELYLPAANFGAAKTDGNFYLFTDEYGNAPFRRWLLYKYKTLEAINAAWGTSYKSIDEVVQPEIKWLKSKRCYTNPIIMISDFNDFKECSSYFYLKNQTDAIRSVDQNHMITIGLHPDQPGIGSEGFAWKHCGIGSAELDNFDYLTLHIYTNFDYLIYRPELPKNIYAPFCANAEDMQRRFRECLLYARFNNFGKPLLLEEFGHHVDDDKECLEDTINTVKALADSVSGFLLWFLGSGDGKNNPGPLSFDLNINSFGQEWKKLNAPGGFVQTELKKGRAPAKTIITLDRLFANVPDSKTVFEKILYNWDAYEHPIDFVMPRNETLAQMKRDGLRFF